MPYKIRQEVINGRTVNFGEGTLYEMIKAAPETIHGGDDPYFRGCTFKEARTASICGFPEIIKEIDAKMRFDNLGQEGIKKVKTHKLSPVGQTYVMPLVMQGIPCNASLSTRIERRVTDNRLNILYVVGGSASVPASTILNGGIAMAKAINALEKEGYKVRLTCASRCSDMHDSKTDFFTAIVKDYEKPISKINLSIVSHPSFFRYYGFGLSERAECRTRWQDGRSNTDWYDILRYIPDDFQKKGTFCILHTSELSRCRDLPALIKRRLEEIKNAK